MEDEERKQGPDIVGTAQNIEGAARLVSKAAKLARAATALFATAEIWVPIVVVGVFIFTFVIVLGGPAVSSTEVPTTPQGGSQITTPDDPNSVYSWATLITNEIQPFFTTCPGENFYINNVLSKVITNGSYSTTTRPGSACGTHIENTYFCTDLVIDSYNLAGIENNFSKGTRIMINQWESIPGLELRRSNNVSGLAPGDAVFWLNGEGVGKHVGLVYNIDVSQLGNGTLTTLDANTNEKLNTFHVRNFSLIGKWLNGANIPWFGLGPR